MYLANYAPIVGDTLDSRSSYPSAAAVTEFGAWIGRASGEALRPGSVHVK